MKVVSHKPQFIVDWPASVVMLPFLLAYLLCYRCSFGIRVILLLIMLSYQFCYCCSCSYYDVAVHVCQPVMLILILLYSCTSCSYTYFLLFLFILTYMLCCCWSCCHTNSAIAVHVHIMLLLFMLANLSC